MKYGNSNLLLTGDVEGAGENNMIQALSRSWNQKSTENLKKEKNSKESEDLLEQSSNHINVLKVGHHGSKNATTDELLDLINPKVAIISCGKDNRYHHPHVEVLERLQARNITYEVTEQHGAITLQFDGKKIKMSVFKKNDNKKCSI